MKNKYYEYIVIYLSVAIVCFAIGLIVRATVISQGIDEFSANTIFWLVTGLGIFVYCALTLVIQGLLDKTVKLFFPKPKEANKESEAEKPLSLDEFRAKKQRELDQQYAERLNTVIRYTKEMFAPYISDAASGSNL